MSVGDPVGGPVGGKPARSRRPGRRRPAPREVRVSVLGDFVVTAGGVPVEAPRMAQRVVALLALRPRGLTRGAVAREIAPHLERERARTELRKSLTALRATRLPLFEADGGALRLHPGISVDVREAEALATRLVDNSQPLPGHVPYEMLAWEVLPDWDDAWAHRARTGRQGRFLHALDVYARRLVSDGDPALALEVAEKALDRDPLRESTVSVLIGIHDDDGNREQALHVYYNYERELAARRGLEPTEAMRRLVAPLLGGQPRP